MGETGYQLPDGYLTEGELEGQVMGITLENVSFTYQEGTPLSSSALTDVSLTIEDGSYTALVGHTGSGKSTILQL